MIQFNPKQAKKSFAAIFLTLLFSSATTTDANAQLFGFKQRVADDQVTVVMPEARAAMSEKLTMGTADGRLVFEFPKYADAEKIAQSIIKNSYSNSHSANGEMYFCKTESDAAQFVIRSGSNQWGQQEKNTKHIKLADLSDSTNRVEIKVNGETNHLSLFSMDLAKKHLHIIRQTSDRITLVAIDGNSFEYMSEKTINDLVAQPNFTTTFDRFRTAGLGVPKLASRSKIETIVESILNFSDADRQKFENDFPDLNSKKFKLRKKAAKELSKQLSEHVVAVSAMLLSDSLPLEMRARFLEAIQNSDDEETVLEINTIVDGKLNAAPTILLRLLNFQTESKADAELIQNTVDQLEKVTDQKFGDDVESWSRWLEESGATDDEKATVPETSAKPEKPSTKKKRKRLRKTGREQVEEPLKDLLTLKLDDSGAIKIDRDHWPKQFGGKTPREVLKEVKQSFAASGLPKSWLVMGGKHSVAGLGYEQILFERIADNVKVRSANYEAYSELQQNKTKSLNRTMYKSDLRMTMHVHKEGNRWKDTRHKRAYFKFLFEDEAEDLFFLLNEQPDQGFSIFVFWKDGETVLNLHSNTDGKVQLDYVAEKEQTSLSADSVEQLVDDNGELINKQIIPLLSKIGISANGAFEKANTAETP